MKKELYEQLQNRFVWLKRPKIERNTEYEYVQEYTLYENWGFSDVSDGWYALLYNLCEEIENAYENEERSVDMILQQVKSNLDICVGIIPCQNMNKGYIQLIPC